MFTKKRAGILMLTLALVTVLAQSAMRPAPVAASDFFPASFTMELCWAFAGFDCSYPTLTAYENGTFEIIDGADTIDSGTWFYNPDNWIFVLLGYNGECYTAYIGRTGGDHFQTFEKGEVYCLEGTVGSGSDRGWFFAAPANEAAATGQWPLRAPSFLIPDFNMEVCWYSEDPGCGYYVELYTEANGTATTSEGAFGYWTYNPAFKSAAYLTTNTSCDEVYVARQNGGGIYEGRVECLDGIIAGGGVVTATTLP